MSRTSPPARGGDVLDAVGYPRPACLGNDDDVLLTDSKSADGMIFVKRQTPPGVPLDSVPSAAIC